MNVDVGRTVASSGPALVTRRFRSTFLDLNGYLGSRRWNNMYRCVASSRWWRNWYHGCLWRLRWYENWRARSPIIIALC